MIHLPTRQIMFISLPVILTLTHHSDIVYDIPSGYIYIYIWHISISRSRSIYIYIYTYLYTYILTFYLTFFPANALTFYRHLFWYTFLAYILTFFLALYLASIMTFYLALYLASSLVFSLSWIRAQARFTPVLAIWSSGPGALHCSLSSLYTHPSHNKLAARQSRKKAEMRTTRCRRRRRGEEELHLC